MDPIQIVIPLHKRGGKLKDDSELRFALRSLDRHFTKPFEVTIIGERLPKWLSGVRHLKIKGGLKTALKAAANEYPSGFFWNYDDCILIKDTTAEEMRVTCACKGWGKAGTGWARALNSVNERLITEGHKAWDYSRPHGPYWFDKSMVDEGFADWPGMKGKFPWESWILSKRDWPRRHGVVKQYYGAFKEPPGEGHWFVNFNEFGFNCDLRSWLYGRFPTKSRFEVNNSLWNQGARAGCVKFQVEILEDRVIKTELEPDERRINSLPREVEIIMELNRKGCPCVPALLDFGKNEKGQNYLVIARIKPVEEPPKAEDIWLSYLAVRGCGYEHGDLMEHNVLFDGRIAWIIDFDRAFPAGASVTWDEGRIDSGLKERFEGFAGEDFDLRKTSLVNRNIYHPVEERLPNSYRMFAGGSRGIDARREALEKIDFKGETVLDIGCNNGAVSRFVARAGATHVQGIEYNRWDAIFGQMINCAAGVENARINQGKIGEGSMIDGKYDTVLLFSVLHHFLNPVAAVTEISRACRKRLLIEARLLEAGHWYGGKGNSTKTGKWKFSSGNDLIAHVQRLFPGFRFSRDYGRGDRNRRILEFVRVENDIDEKI